METALPKIEGHGTANRLPRVTLRMTTRQLQRIREALAVADPVQDGLGGYDPQQHAEWEAIAAALEGVEDLLHTGAKTFGLADISLAPTVGISTPVYNVAALDRYDLDYNHSEGHHIWKVPGGAYLDRDEVLALFEREDTNNG